jgi:hypothetical protein
MNVFRFVASLREGEKMAALCQEFAISRKTGYKIFVRYKLSPMSRVVQPLPLHLFTLASLFQPSVRFLN